MLSSWKPASPNSAEPQLQEEILGPTTLLVNWNGRKDMLAAEALEGT